jgi:hypothetical protein
VFDHHQRWEITMNTFTATYAQTWKVGLFIVLAALGSSMLAAKAAQHSVAAGRAPGVVAVHATVPATQPVIRRDW